MDTAGGFVNSTNHKMSLTADSVFGNATSFSHNLCIGYMCIAFGPRGEILGVTFLLDLNISGPAGDVAFVDNKTTGLYRAKDLVKYFVCIQDPTITGNPAFGIVYSGSNLRYIRLDNASSFALRLSQDQPGNKFVIPVTSNGCDAIRNNLPLSLPLISFVPVSDALNAIELILSYPVDLIGNFERTGKFKLILEKNETEIIGRPG